MTCPHRRVIPDGVRLERVRGRDGGMMRFVYELGTCRDCRERVQRSWELRHHGQWHRKPDDISQQRDSA